MPLRLSQADLKRAATRAESLRSRLAGIRKRTEKVTEQAVRTVEISTAAFGWGIIEGRFYDPSRPEESAATVAGVPVALGLGLGLNLAGFLGLAGDRMSEHLHGFGDGFLAAYLTIRGVSVGKSWAPGAAADPGQGTGRLEGSRSVGSMGAAGFTDSELARAVAAAVTGASRAEEP
jgi:hypothetical protein